MSGDLDESASQLVEQNVIAIVALGTPAVLAARRATKTIPIIMVGVADPVSIGLVASLARPGGNVTGVSFFGPEVVAKSLDLLVEVASAQRLFASVQVTVLWNPRNPSAAHIISAIRPTADRRRIVLRLIEAQTSVELTSALELAKNVAWLLVIDDAVFSSAQEVLVDFATKHKVGTMFHVRSPVVNGALMAYGPSEIKLYEMAGKYLSKILAGEKPDNVPVEQPTKFDLVVNMKAARALGLTIPQSVLLRADQVIDP